MKRIIKYATKRLSSYGGSDNGGGGGGNSSSNNLRASSSSEKMNAEWGNTAAASSSSSFNRALSPSGMEGGTQEALISALQGTVLEQSQRLKDQGSTIDRLHAECREQTHHVQALQRILHMVKTSSSSSVVTTTSTASALVQEGGVEGKPPERRQQLDRSLLLPTPIPPQFYSHHDGKEGRRRRRSNKNDSEHQQEGKRGDEEAEENENDNDDDDAGSIDSFGVRDAHDDDDTGGVGGGRGDGSGNEYGPSAHSPSSWLVDDHHMMSVEDASAKLMGQILERLHMEEDRVRIQEEELRAYQVRFEAQEKELMEMEKEKTRNEMLIQGLKKELSAFKHKLRARDFKEANMEVEIDRYRAQRKSMSRMLSNVVDGNGTPLNETFFSTVEGGGQMSVYSGNSEDMANSPMHSIASSSAAASPMKSTHTPIMMEQRLLPLHSLNEGGGGGGDERGLITPSSTATGLLPPRHQASPPKTPAEVMQLRLETAALQAELEAARGVSEIEVRKRVAAEHEVEMLRKVLDTLGINSHHLPGEEEEDDEGTDDDEGKGGGGLRRNDISSGEVTSLVIKDQLSAIRDLNPEFQKMWEEATTEFKVRGQSYMVDGVKVDAHDPLFELVHMELLDVETLGGGGGGGSRVYRADHVTAMFKDTDGVYSRCQLLASRPPPFLLILNFQIPGNPACSMMVYFAVSGYKRQKLERLRNDIKRRRRKAQQQKQQQKKKNADDGSARRSSRIPPEDEVEKDGGGELEEEEEEDEDMWAPSPTRSSGGHASSSSSSSSPEEKRRRRKTCDNNNQEQEEEEEEEEEVVTENDKALRLLAEFLEGDEEHRNARFKLIPSVVEGSYIIRYSVGNKPVLLGKKLTQRYWEGPGYLEIGIDIGSSTIASRVVGLVRDFSKSVGVEIAVLIQGENEEELPEKILGSVRCSHIDWALAENLSTRLLPQTPRSLAP